MKSIPYHEINHERKKIISKEKTIKKDISLKDRINERIATEALKNNSNFAQGIQLPNNSKPIKLTDKNNKIESIYNSYLPYKEKEIPKSFNSNSKDNISNILNNNVSSTIVLENQKVMNINELKKNNYSQSFLHNYNSINNNKDNTLKIDNNHTILKTSISKDKNRRNNVSSDGIIQKNISDIKPISSKYARNSRNEHSYDLGASDINRMFTEEVKIHKRKNSFQIENFSILKTLKADKLNSVNSERIIRNISANLLRGNRSMLGEVNKDDNPMNVNKLFKFAKAKHTSTLHNIYSSYSKKLSDYLLKHKENILLFGNSKYHNKKAKFYLEDHKFKQNSLFDNTGPKIEFEEKLITKAPKFTFDTNAKEEKEVHYQINETRGGKVDLTPLPAKARRNIKTKREKSEFYNVERSAVAMRRFEYTHKLKPHTLKITKETILKPTISLLRAVTTLQRVWRRYLYLFYIPRAIFIQKIIRGYLVKKKIGYIVFLFKQVKIKLKMLEEIISIKRIRRNYNKLLVNMKKKIRFNDLIRKLKLVQRNVIKFLYLRRAKRNKLLYRSYLFNHQKYNIQSGIRLKYIIKSVSITKNVRTNLNRFISLITKLFTRFNIIKRKLKVLIERKSLPIFTISKINKQKILKRVSIQKQILITKSILISNSLCNIKKKTFNLNPCYITKKILSSHKFLRELSIIQNYIKSVILKKESFRLKFNKNLRKIIGKTKGILIEKKNKTNYELKNILIIQKYLKDKIIKKINDKNKTSLNLIKSKIVLPYLVPYVTKINKTKYPSKILDILNKWIVNHVLTKRSIINIRKNIQFNLKPIINTYCTKKSILKLIDSKIRIIQRFIKRFSKVNDTKDYLTYKLSGNKNSKRDLDEKFGHDKPIITPFITKKYIYRNTNIRIIKPIKINEIFLKTFKLGLIDQMVRCIQNFLRKKYKIKTYKRIYDNNYKIAPYIKKENFSQSFYMKKKSMIIQKYFRLYGSKYFKYLNSKKIVLNTRCVIRHDSFSTTKINKFSSQMLKRYLNKIINALQIYYKKVYRNKLMLKIAMVKVNMESITFKYLFKKWIQLSKLKYIKKINHLHVQNDILNLFQINKKIYFEKFVDLVKIKDIKLLKSQNIPSALKEEAKKFRFSKISRKILYKCTTFLIGYLSIFFLRWKREIYYSKYKKAIKLIGTLLKKNCYENYLRKKAVNCFHKLFTGFQTSYIKKYTQSILEIFDILYQRNKCLSFEQFLFTKEKFEFIHNMKHMQTLTNSLTKIINKKEKNRIYISKRYFQEWYLIVTIYKQVILKIRRKEADIFLNKLTYSQCYLLINKLKENSAKMLKFYYLLEKLGNTCLIRMKFNNWRILLESQKQIYKGFFSLYKIIDSNLTKNAFIAFYEFLNKFKVQHFLKKKQEFLIEKLNINIHSAIKREYFLFLTNRIKKGILLNSNDKKQKIITYLNYSYDNVKYIFIQVIRLSFFKKFHSNVSNFLSTSDKLIINKSSKSNIHFSIPIIKDIISAFLSNQKKIFFSLLKQRGYTIQSNNEFTDFFVNYIKYKLKYNVFGMLSEFNAKHFAKQVLRKAYFRRFLVNLIKDLLLSTRKFIRLTDFLFTVSYHYKQQLSRIFFTRLVRSLINNINDKRKHIMMSLLDEGFKDNHLNLYFMNKNKHSIKRLYSFDEEGTYIRNVYSYKWYDETASKFINIKNSVKKERSLFDYYLNFVGKLNNELNCVKCRHSVMEKVFCSECSKHKWEKNDLIHIYNSENTYFQKKKRKNKFLDELKIQKGISDTLEAKSYRTLTPTNPVIENFIPLKHTSSFDKNLSEDSSSLRLKYKITQTKKSAETKKFNINDVFVKINQSKKSNENLTDIIKDTNNLDNKSVFSLIDTEEKINESVVSVKKYTITNRKLNNNISAALKTIRKNADKKEMIVLRDEDIDIMKEI